MSCGDIILFPDTFKEFCDIYSFVDTEEFYTNGVKLIPVFRVEQWLDHIKDKNYEDDGR